MFPRLPQQATVPGLAGRPALRGEKLARPRPLYWQFPFGVGLRDGSVNASPGLALRDGNWKLHCDVNFEEVMLFDLDADRNDGVGVGVDRDRVARLL